MTLNSDVKFQKVLTLRFKNWHEELGELSLRHSKIWIFLLWWALFVQGAMFQLENFRGNMSHDTERWLMAWKLTRNLVDSHASSWKAEKLHLISFFCLKNIKFSMKKNRRDLSRHWRVMQSLKKNWFLVSKMTLRFW